MDHIRKIAKIASRHKGKLFISSAGSLFIYSMSRNDDDDYKHQHSIKPSSASSLLPPPGPEHHLYTLRNRVWTEEELKNRYKTAKKHYEPKTTMDKSTYWFLRGLYNAFNFVTLFDKNDPSESSMVLRLILLESVAGVPPFIMAGYRHFRSLRNITYDGGRIYTHLEEAENERMHLICCMQAFEATWKMKLLVYGAQVFITPFCWFFCLLKPQYLNRFVGYLEELACETYSSVLDHVNNPDKKLYKAWHDKPAPPAAIEYWKLDKNATWPDVLRYIYTDETQHRDINHCFADISVNARNPLMHHHLENYERTLE